MKYFDTEFPKRDSYILLCKYMENGTLFQFICNRNSWDFNQLYNDKYIKWFEYENIPSVMSIDNSSVDILEILGGVDNWKRRHQKDILNPCKIRWMNTIIDAKDDNEVITNKIIGSYQKSIRQLISDRYFTIRNHINSMDIDEIYDLIKQIWFNERLMKELDKPRYKFMSNMDSMTDIGVVAVVFRDYLLNRKNHNQKFPFDKGSKIRRTIEIEKRDGLRTY